MDRSQKEGRGSRRDDCPLAEQIRMPKEKKTRNVKPSSKVHEGVELDSKFPHVSLIALKRT
jgi:hypothetical protein